MRMEQIEGAVDRVMERQRPRIRCRLMHAGERLPWTEEELGWDQQQLHPETVFVAEQDGQVCGVIVAAEVHATLLLVRMLGSGGAWLRPLWRFIRLVCFQRHIAGVWMFAENRLVTERKLLRLIARNVDQAESREMTIQLFAGRFHFAGSTSSTMACPLVDGGGHGSDAGHDSLRAGEQTELVIDVDLEQHGRAAGGGAEGAAAGGDPGAAGEHAGADRREPDPDHLCDDLGESRRAAVRSQLRDAVFGGQR